MRGDRLARRVQGLKTDSKQAKEAEAKVMSRPALARAIAGNPALRKDHSPGVMDQVEVRALRAECGREPGMDDAVKNRVTCRLHKGTLLEDLGDGVAYRNRYRDETSEAARRLWQGLGNNLEQSTRKVLGTLIRHPALEVAPGQERERRSRFQGQCAAHGDYRQPLPEEEPEREAGADAAGVKVVERTGCDSVASARGAGDGVGGE